MTATNETAPVVGLLDVEDTPAARDSRLPEPRALYNQWEKQQWAIAQVNVRRDHEQWETLRPFARQELLGALNELETGEVFVSRTLSTLVGFAPSDPDRLFLSTQVADEARHAQFFQDYRLEAVGLEDAADDDDSAYAQLFEPTLRTSLEQVAATGGDVGWWHTAVVEYHLVTEGILAAAALHLTRRIARRFSLPALEEGLGNVIRDESRHFTYGLAVTRQAAEGPLRDRITQVYLNGVEASARIMVNPQRKSAAPVLRPALLQRAALLSTQWDLTRTRALRQLRLMGLPELREDAEKIWDRTLETALSEYADVWGTPHPVAAAR
ncbi:hypothetical protein GCM10022223_51150 [Kineosporia mesophila]|uniref:Uncharacterized protein n=1 Tax=Kineosporia mesophila TaxID=566012 RepID=A0ABP7A9Q0_9ACTN|nr:ribonucleotide-diphosphate reductase subunit beta [Kineosporia mesophila]MCD5354696.1 ribonucleotide-diphosphate reductase subunit beta [Kineosporia mesophila]